jgi:hypothetical protein
MINVKAATLALGAFFALTYTLCVLYGLLVPEGMHELLETLLPGFRWLTVGSFFLGLIETFVYGVYAGLVFSPLYNAFARREASRRAHASA